MLLLHVYCKGLSGQKPPILVTLLKCCNILLPSKLLWDSNSVGFKFKLSSYNIKGDSFQSVFIRKISKCQP